MVTRTFVVAALLVVGAGNGLKTVPLYASEGQARRTGSIATIKDIRRTVLPDAVRVIIELDGEVPFRDERIGNPERVFVDLPGTRPAPVLVDHTIRFESDADVVRQVRVGQHPNSTTRVVLDAGGISTYSVYPLYGPFRIVIDCVRAASVAAESAPLGAAVEPRTPNPDLR